MLSKLSWICTTRRRNFQCLTGIQYAPWQCGRLGDSNAATEAPGSSSCWLPRSSRCKAPRVVISSSCSLLGVQDICVISPPTCICGHQRLPAAVYTCSTFDKQVLGIVFSITWSPLNPYLLTRNYRVTLLERNRGPLRLEHMHAVRL